MERRIGKRPSWPYRRPVRDRIISQCRIERRLPTSDEKGDIGAEAMAMAVGYHLASIMEEDNKIQDKLERWVNGDDDDSDGSEGGDYNYIPRLDL